MDRQKVRAREHPDSQRTAKRESSYTGEAEADRQTDTEKEDMLAELPQGTLEREEVGRTESRTRLVTLIYEGLERSWLPNPVIWLLP